MCVCVYICACRYFCVSVIPFVQLACDVCGMFGVCVAAHPIRHFVAPVAISFDDLGRLWVLDHGLYGKFASTTVGINTIVRPVSTKLVLF